jgi:hypothetical protein
MALHKLVEAGQDTVVAINAVCTGALAARAYLRFLFADGGPAPALVAYQAKLFELVNAPWPRDGFYSLAGCHLVLHGFISALLPHLSAADVAPPSFHAVLEALPRILNKAPRRRESFLALWAELGTLPGSEPPALPRGSALIGGSSRYVSRSA